MNDAESLDELRWGSGFIDITLGSSGDSLEHVFIVHTRAGYDNAQVGADSFKAGHDIIKILATAVAKQHQIDGRELAKISERGGDQFQIGFGIKKGPEPNKAQRIAFYYGYTNRRFSSDSSFH